MATATLLRENIKQSERVDSPFVLGLLRPTIYLPYAMDEGDMGHVISHERAHIRRGDHWWKPLGFLILSVYWFNPLVWVAYILFCRDMELACDEKVAANMAREERQAYSTALLHCGVRRRTVAACPLAFGEVGVKSRVRSVMHYKKPAFWVVLIAVVACIVVAVCFLTVPKNDGPHTLEVTGLPAPESGRDPYKNLEPTERAAAFLKNADNMSYENSILMHGEHIMITMEYKARTEQLTDPASGTTFTQTFDHTNLILESLQKVDLTALRQMELAEINSFDIQVSTSGLIHVGDARCRAAVWYDQRPALDQEYTAALVFTFSDGTVCAFEEQISGTGMAADLAYAISIAGWATSYSLFPQGGDVSVIQLSSGKTGGTSAYGSAWITAIFENTPRLASSVKEHNGQFDYQVTLADSSVYLFDDENLLLQAPNGQVYPIGGFEEESALPIEKLICGLVTGGTVSNEPPSAEENPDVTEPEPTESIVITKPEDGTRELQQAVWQVTVDGGLSPEDAAWEMARQIAANYLALPDGTSWKPENIRVTDAEVFDHYWGETPQFCFNIGFEIKLTREQRWQTGPWGSWGGEDEDGDGWWPFGAEVSVEKNVDGNWTYRSWGTGGYTVLLNDGEGLEYLLDCFWLTEGWTHDWVLPCTILDMTDEQLKDLPSLLDQRTEAEAKEFCAHLGNMLREYDYWVQTTESLTPILGRYGSYLDA